MKIKGLNPKTAIATGAYYFVLIALVGLLGLVMVKIAFSPPCTTIVQRECVIDGWSVAGLAATIFAIGAAVLTFLGAFAVAAWWRNLNQQVDDRVDTQMKERVKQILEDQEKKLNDQTTFLLGEQTKASEEILVKIRGEMEVLDKKAAHIEGRLLQAQKTMIIAAMLHEPWDMEQWASEVMAIDPLSEVAVRMVLKYLHVVDGFSSKDPSEVAKHLEYLEKSSAPYQNPLEYWKAALRWQQVVLAQNNPTYMAAAESEMLKRLTLVSGWEAQRIRDGEDVFK